MLRLILVLDDSAAVCDAVSRVLKAAGYASVFVLSAREAMKLVDVFTPSLMMIDYHMPVMSGIEFLDYIRHSDDRFKGVPVIGVGTDEKTCQEFLDHGADAAIRKPFNATELLALLERLLVGRQTTRV
jgi:CheY-like chemotaxis protein